MVECWLEASTEQSESKPGRSLGTITMKRRAVWKTVPPHKRSIRVNPLSMLISKFFDHYYQFVLRFYIQG